MYDIDLPPKQIDLPIDPNKQDPDFQIKRMWIEATPYMPGNNCIFYAVQGALMHFNQKALSYEKLKEYQEEIRKGEDRLRRSVPVEGVGVYSSIDMIARKLEPEGIEPEEIFTSQKSADTMRSFLPTKRFGNLLKVIASEEKVKIPFPSLIITNRLGGGSHVYFASDKSRFSKEMREHISPDDNITTIIKLHKVNKSLNHPTGDM